LFVVAALLALLALVRVFRRYRAPASAIDRPITDGAILRGVRRELAAVRRERENGGWTPALAGRALAALRLAATYALGRRVGYTDLGPITNPQSPLRNPHFEDPGRLALTTGLFKRKPLAVSGAVTAGSVAREQARATNAKRAAMLESLAQALNALTTAQYGR